MSVVQDTQKLAAVGLEKSELDVPDDRMVGRDLGDFAVLSLMSQGGMGRVYRARENRTGREAVVKTIIPEEMIDETALQRFLREIDMGARIEHPNIVEFLGTGQVGPTLYLAMEYFAGKHLRHRFSATPASFETAVAIGQQIASALVAAHAQDVVHRDIKPDNVLVNDAKVSPPSESACMTSSRVGASLYAQGRAMVFPWHPPGDRAPQRVTRGRRSIDPL